MLVAAAVTRDDAANYVAALFEVYIALIFIYILANLAFAFGARPSYSRALDTVMSFLRDVCEPYLRIFRKLMPSFGSFDFSPWVAIIVLYALDDVVTRLIRG